MNKWHLFIKIQHKSVYVLTTLKCEKNTFKKGYKESKLIKQSLLNVCTEQVLTAILRIMWAQAKLPPQLMWKHIKYKCEMSEDKESSQLCIYRKQESPWETFSGVCAGKEKTLALESNINLSISKTNLCNLKVIYLVSCYCFYLCSIC